MKSFFLVLSLLLNILLLGSLFYTFVDGCAEAADGKIGVLAKNIEIGPFGEDKLLFTLPKGLVVRDASAIGADWFEPNRFRLVITTNEQDLVDYQQKSAPLHKQDSEYYSAHDTSKR